MNIWEVLGIIATSAGYVIAGTLIGIGIIKHFDL